MKKETILWVLVALVAVLLIGYMVINGREVNSPDEVPAGNSEGQNENPAQSGGNNQAQKQFVNVYVIDLEKKTGKGSAIGCGDAVVALQREIPPTVEVLRSALESLFGINNREIQDGGVTYYNALADSNVSIDSLTIVNGEADVKLSGELRSGGTCDDPRIIAQITETVEQFPTVTSSKIYINNILLGSYFSQ